MIVDPKFCVPDPVELAMVRDNIDFKLGDFVIEDVNGNVLFQVKKPGFFSRKMILLDGSGSPVLTMKQKTMTLHERWNVFKGGSTEECDFLYTVKKSKLVQFTTKLDVFLGHNNEEQTCDFRVNVSKRWKHSCVVYADESDAIVAQMDHTQHSASSGLDHFSVTVNPNVDYAFIASLIVLFDVINRENTPRKSEADAMTEVTHGLHKAVHVLHHLLH